MMVSINNVVQNNWIFISILTVVILLSIRPKKNQEFSNSVTQEIKGFAILAIIFSHIGYFLITDHQFLFPLSVLAGVGVNLFLFLSGYGLAVSNSKDNNGIFNFYKKRFLRLLIPFWIVLISFLLLDYFVLKISYEKILIIKSFFGIFTSADIFQALNSPFWYITLILFYYILFPLVYFKKHPWVSGFLIYFISYYLLMKINLVWFEDVIKLYKLHIIAFPLGIITFSIFNEEKIKKNFLILKTKEIYKKFEKFIYPILISALVLIISYFAINSGIGESIKIEQNISIITMIAIVILFLIKKFEFKLLTFLGIYSYELYLIHWPIMYRYEFLYKYFPAWIATFLYLIFFVFIAWILQKISKKLLHLFK